MVCPNVVIRGKSGCRQPNTGDRTMILNLPSPQFDDAVAAASQSTTPGPGIDTRSARNAPPGTRRTDPEDLAPSPNLPTLSPMKHPRQRLLVLSTGSQGPRVPGPGLSRPGNQGGFGRTLTWRTAAVWHGVLSLLLFASPSVSAATATNPVLHADVPDLAMIRVNDTYYMSSTTMHLSPGVPIMKSTDLVNWEIVNYAYDTLEDIDALNLANGRTAYGRGSWASSLRHHRGTYYVTTFAQTTGKTHVYSTRDIERGPWKASSFRPALHDHSLFFDDDDRVYMLYGAGNLRLAELNPDLSGLKPGGFHQVVITNASAVAGPNTGLPAEGSQLLKVQGRYYLFNIVWPRGGMRTVLVHRADRITGPWEGRVALADKGVAQGSLIDTPRGEWFAYLFRDSGAVGRIPYLVPVTWEDGWPVLGVDGKVPDTLNLPPSRGLLPGIVASDEFDRQPGERPLPLVWQWNHNPDPALWSLTARPGFLRLTTGRVDPDLEAARNTLTQRTLGPECSGSTLLDVRHLRDGDVAGLVLLAKNYGVVGVKAEGDTKFLVMVSAETHPPVETARIPLTQSLVHLRGDGDFRNRADQARFHYSLDGESWQPIGGPLKMTYTLAHFMGYRFGLFCYSTKSAGGHADFDFFRVRSEIP